MKLAVYQWSKTQKRIYLDKIKEYMLKRKKKKFEEAQALKLHLEHKRAEGK